MPRTTGQHSKIFRSHFCFMINSNWCLFKVFADLLMEQSKARIVQADLFYFIHFDHYMNHVSSYFIYLLVKVVSLAICH